MIFHLAIKTINTAVRVTTHDPTFYSRVRISQITSRDENTTGSLEMHTLLNSLGADVIAKYRMNNMIGSVQEISHTMICAPRNESD